MVNDHMMAILANRREALGLSALEVQAARRVSLSNYGNVGRKRPFGPTVARKRLDFQSWKSKRLSTIGHLGRPVELLAFLSSCLAFPLLLLSLPSPCTFFWCTIIRQYPAGFLVSTSRYFSVQNDYAYLFRHHAAHQPEHHPGGACRSFRYC